MCWSAEISLVAAAYGYLVSAYLYRRHYSKRDPWYAAFLATFTTTQLIDAVLWIEKGDLDDIPCTTTNYILSKFILPPVLCFQPVVLSFYPSKTFPGCWRWIYRLLALVGSIMLTLIYGCSVVWKTSIGPDRFPTILWGGVDLPEYLVYAGIALWSIGAVGFVSPIRYALQIILVGGVVLSLLVYFDGTITLLSKMCTYCLLLSFVWTLEPLWTPPEKSAADDEAGDDQRENNQLQYVSLI